MSDSVVDKAAKTSEMKEIDAKMVLNILSKSSSNTIIGDFVYCMECGTKIKRSDRFCLNCGTENMFLK